MHIQHLVQPIHDCVVLQLKSHIGFAQACRPALAAAGNNGCQIQLAKKPVFFVILHSPGSLCALLCYPRLHPYNWHSYSWRICCCTLSIAASSAAGAAAFAPIKDRASTTSITSAAEYASTAAAVAAAAAPAVAAPGPAQQRVSRHLCHSAGPEQHQWLLRHVHGAANSLTRLWQQQQQQQSQQQSVTL
jgi:hypothetical protein